MESVLRTNWVNEYAFDFSRGYFYFSAGYFCYDEFNKTDVSMRRLPPFPGQPAMAA